MASLGKQYEKGKKGTEFVTEDDLLQDHQPFYQHSDDQQKVNGVSERHAVLTLNSSQIRSELAQLRVDNTKLLAFKKELQDKHEEDSNTINSMRSEVDTHKSRFENLMSRYKSLEEQKTKLEARISQLEGSCGQCPPKWELMNDTCYYFSVSSGNRGWNEGREDCRSKGADLAVIDTVEKQEFITKALRELRHSSSHIYQNGYWIGLKDDVSEGTWRWLNGSELVTSYWMPGEPNDDLGIEDCAAIYPAGNLRKSWNDVPCSHPLKWICEKPQEKQP
ncbi:C-type lectin domain family 4 member E isoform X2 [Chanos chanos]|uniref:C-type lectin domain family 4 member E isoform X2 n=1 Tax=Chanos chanos TaxID=29144 RepID=A0A6J2V013_CHACN|nr:C-type lectin domain family 4 member E-like isoform X2 [Chanos chanos]